MSTGQEHGSQSDTRLLRASDTVYFKASKMSSDILGTAKSYG